MSSPLLKHAFTGLGGAILVLFAGMLCLTTNAHTGFSSVLWLPLAISFSLLFMGGLQFWPWLLAGELAIYVQAHFPWPVVILVPVGSTAIQCFFAQKLRQGLSPEASFARLQDLRKFLALGFLVLPLVNASYDVSIHVLFGNLTSDRLFETWRSWWTGQGMGLLVVGGFLLNWRNDRIHRQALLKKTESRSHFFRSVNFRHECLYFYAFVAIQSYASRETLFSFLAHALVFSAV